MPEPFDSPIDDATAERAIRFDELIVRLREGSEDAAKQLLEEFGPSVVRVIRRRMNSHLRERFDSQDFTQAVWASFFGNLPTVSQFNSADDLVKFLSRVASNKVIDAGRRTGTTPAMHTDGMHEVGVSRDNRVGVSEPTPSQHAVAREQIDHLLKGEDEVTCRVVMLRSEGCTQPEISEQLGISERHVRRILARIARKTIE